MKNGKQSKWKKSLLPTTYNFNRCYLCPADTDAQASNSVLFIIFNLNSTQLKVIQDRCKQAKK